MTDNVVVIMKDQSTQVFRADGYRVIGGFVDVMKRTSGGWKPDIVATIASGTWQAVRLIRSEQE